MHGESCSWPVAARISVYREARQTRCPERDRTTNRRTERYGDSHFTLGSARKRRVASSVLEDGATTDTLTHSTVWAPCAS